MPTTSPKPMEEPHIEIAANDRQKVAQALSRLLADTYTLYVKTQGYHWNVTGPTFHQLHEMFEVQYKQLAEAVDDIAERIRALGHMAPAGLKAFAALTAIPDNEGAPAAQVMVSDLVQGHEAVIRTIRDVLHEAEAGDDEVTADLMVTRLAEHEKTAWMLRATGA